ncbi:hypothetical protein [Arcicella rosea]|uniref:Uncharacterized protein n=1 Tax=Arcicella rosea TaxID=502909 RepID=A0A841EHP7_9BACT|nr:hypothetical protein [Arcicella rosea]MBB6002685.1 hypothetical protein [Arcicella rosea]
MRRKIAMVFNQTDLKNSNQSLEDFSFWLSKTPQERLAAVTFLVNRNLKTFQRMDKTISSQKIMK